MVKQRLIIDRATATKFSANLFIQSITEQQRDIACWKMGEIFPLSLLCVCWLSVIRWVRNR